jgi:hypothetical protein
MPAYQGCTLFKYAVSTNLCRFGSKAAFLKKIIFSVLIFLVGHVAWSQVSPETFLPGVDTIDNITPIEESSFLFIDSTRNLPVEQIAKQQFIPFLQYADRKNKKLLI